MYNLQPRRVYKGCPSIGSDTTNTMVLQHYPLYQEDTISNLSRHSLNTLVCMQGVRCKRVCIKFPGIGSCRYRTVPRRPHMIVERNSTQVLDFITCLSTVLYICHPTLGNLMQTLLHLTISIQKSVFKLCLLKSDMVSSCYRG